MTIKNLFKGIKYENQNIDNLSVFNEKINKIEINSLKIQKNDIFIAIKGVKFDGNDFIDEAISRGAMLVITDDKTVKNDKIVYVENARKTYAILSKNFFHSACDNMKIIAVTGTNGKTTIVNILYEILSKLNINVGVIGTLGAKFGDKFIDTSMTTPDPFMLHKIFFQMYRYGCKFVFIEASAHAIYLDKLEGIKFEVACLTNITQDHLDFFIDMKKYAESKFKLFDKKRTKNAVIFWNNDYCQTLIKRIKVPFLVYGREKICDISYEEISKTLYGTHFVLIDKTGEKINISTKLVGDFNIYNILACMSILKVLGFDLNKCQEKLKMINPVEGRFNVLSYPNNVNIILDFAHTPDGLENVLKTIKDVSIDKVITVFGCGGNRDRNKRRLMGAIASKYSDKIVLTSDNPRYENPRSIIDDIVKGIDKKTYIEIDRKKAIEFVLKKYKKRVNILIAGKAGEKTQEIDGKFLYFEDKIVVKNFYSKFYN